MGMCGIIFDLDGVLCYTDHYHYLAWKAVADRLSLPFDEQVNNRLRGVSRMESLEIILSLGSKTYSQEEKEQMAAEKNRLYRSYLERMGPEALAPGAVDVLRTLRENGWKTGIGSSSKNAPLILERTGLDGFFDAVADGSQITKSKPDPEVFRLAARKLRLSPDECAVVEDASAGILAANAGGFFPIGLGDAAQLLEEAEQYELLPEVAETWDYAELMARETYPDLPSELFQTPQAAQIGRTMLEEGNGAITEYGLIRRTDGQPLPVFTGKPQREEFAGPQMTGM